MATTEEKSSERTAMERFGGGGMALLPWTKQMLSGLWGQLRLLLQVIYYTFVSGENMAEVKELHLFNFLTSCWISYLNFC